MRVKSDIKYKAIKYKAIKYKTMGSMALLVVSTAFACSRMSHATEKEMNDQSKDSETNMSEVEKSADMSAEKKKLSVLQYEVTQKAGTEPPFRNEFWDHKKHGIYVDVVSGEALFSSLDKYDSGSGWPSFTKPLATQNIVNLKDHKLLMERVEVRSKSADSHLGHVFPDGPGPEGLRYCINSASLRFVAVSQLAEEGYSDHLQAFVDAGVVDVLALDAVSEEVAILAGGCFWGMEDILRKIPGVLDTQVGYTGGDAKDPVYEIVKTGRSGHAESLKIVFDPTKLTYRRLLEVFFQMHDPTTVNQQGNDRGTQYRSAIFFTTPKQEEVALEVIEAATQAALWKAPIVTKVESASNFYDAEGYHQDYLEKNPGGYSCHYVRDFK